MGQKDWQARAEWLTRHHDIPRLKYLNARRDADQLLASVSDFDEVVFWFEYDLHCQANLVYWLFQCDRLRFHRTRTKLSLICPREMPDRPDFRGLGELMPDEMQWLFERRERLTQPSLALGRRAWLAWASDTPELLSSLVAESPSLLPCLVPALVAHLERFPERETGLSELEREILDTLGSAGGVEFSELFSRVSTNVPLLGFGDLQFASLLRRLASTAVPLIRLVSADAALGAGARQRVLLTDYGRSVSDEKANAWKHFRERNQDSESSDWVGGVAMTPESGWVWDHESGSVRFVDSFLS